MITQAIQDHLYFGLGKNGCVLEEFWFASEYLYTVRSTDPKTWEPSRYVDRSYEDRSDGNRIRFSEVVRLTDAELESMCFDRQYLSAGMDRVMPFDLFVRKLEEQRLVILSSSWQQVITYLAPGKTLSIDDEMQLLGALVHPSEPDELGSAVEAVRR